MVVRFIIFFFFFLFGKHVRFIISFRIGENDNKEPTTLKTKAPANRIMAQNWPKA